MTDLQQNYSDFDPWPFLNRIAGMFVLIIGFVWLGKTSEPLVHTTRILVLTSGVFWGLVIRMKPVAGYMGIPVGRHKMRRLLAVSSVAMLCLGLVLGMMSLQPYTNAAALHFLAGATLLFFGGRFITVTKAKKLKTNSTIHHQESSKGMEEDSLP